MNQVVKQIIIAVGVIGAEKLLNFIMSRRKHVA